MGISSSTVRDAPDLLIRALAILSDATVRRYAVDEKTWNHTQNQKKKKKEMASKPIIYKA